MKDDTKPATKKPTTAVKPQKIAYPRFMNAIDTFLDGAGLTHQSTIGDLMDALRDAHIDEARG